MSSGALREPAPPLGSSLVARAPPARDSVLVFPLPLVGSVVVDTVVVGCVAYSAGMTLAEERSIIGALSPSRAGDFMTCPLLYRFRVIDQLPERPSPAAVRGTLVHAV